MSEFVVSARKYRPQVFDDVVGQSHITITLKNAIKTNKVAHAFLFCGPRGVGKTTCARILAKTLNCLNRTDNIEACNKCESCEAFNTSHSFNIHELDAASNNGVDDIRSLTEQVRIPPQIGKYSIYIIDEVHMLSTAAFNAFLKTLEEPPAHAIFILATTEKHKILPTILSRCQIFDFKRITIDDAARHLARIAQNEGITAEADALHIIAQKADGAMRDALSIFDRMVTFCGNNLTYNAVIENLNILDYDYFFGIVDNALKGNIAELLITYNQILDKGFDGQHFLSGLAEHLRNILVASDPKTIILLELGENVKRKYFEQASVANSSFVLEALRIINKADQEYRTSNNKRLTVELALMNIATIEVAPLANSAIQKNGGIQSTSASVASESAPSKIQKPIEAIKVNPGSLSLGSLKSTPGIADEKKKLSNQHQIEAKLVNEPTAEVEKLTVIKESSVEKIIHPIESQINLKNLQEVWTEYANIQQEKKKVALHATLTIHPIRLDGNTIVLPVDNSSQVELLLNERVELMNYIRNQLNNFELDFKTELKEKDSDKELKPYTDKEKFEKMAASNPVLLLFQEKLGFEFEY